MRFRSRRRRKLSTTTATAPKQHATEARMEEKRREESSDVTTSRSSRSSSGTTTTGGSLSRTQAGVRESRRFFSLASKILGTTAAGQDADDDDPLLDLEELLKQTWNIWGVSALFDFNSNDEVQLKQYGKKLREEVARILSKDDVSYDAKITVLDLQRPKETDHPVVKIEVIARVEEREIETTVYRGYLLSWRSEPVDSIASNATQLPLLLCRGTINTIRAVHATLGRMFDCLFVALPANADDLAWLLLIFISPGGGQEEARENDLALLEYAMPSMSTKEMITVKFRINNLIDLWKSFSEDRSQIDVEEIEKFHEILQFQVMDLFSLQLGLCILHKIELPSITVSESKMKVMNVEAMNTVLTYLNEKALDALHINTSLLSISK